MVSAVISRLVILLFGTLYPAYASYKAVRTKNVKEYVKWMMYWIVFALFSAIETFSDVLLSWMPFYYEVKIVFVLWMLSPMTKGSSFLFKKFVHPQLARREKDIDEMIDQARNQSYSTLVKLGSRGLNFASQVVVRTALMGQTKLVDHLRRSYSTSDLSNDGAHRVPRHMPLDEDEDEDELDNRLQEDQAVLAQRSRGGKRVTRSSSMSAAGLHSVKEEAVDEEEVSVTEEYSIPLATRQHFSPKEGEDSGHSTCSSSSSFSALSSASPSSTPPSRLRHNLGRSWSASPTRSFVHGSDSGRELRRHYIPSGTSSGHPGLITASAAAFMERYRHPGGESLYTSSLYPRTSSYFSVLSSLSRSSLDSSSSSSSLSAWSPSLSSRQRRWGSWSSPGSPASRLHKY